MTNHLTAFDPQAPLMSWEPIEQYQALHAEPQAEHSPQGATERHLVEELALTIWRRRRLRAAEQVEILQGLPQGDGVIGYGEDGRHFVAGQLEAITGRRNKELNPVEFLRITDDERERELAACVDESTKIDAACKLLDTGKKADYLRAVQTTTECGWDWTAEADWQTDSDELRDELNQHRTQTLEPRLSALRHSRTIAMLATAYSYTQANTLDLMKLDLALNRKMAETLTMLEQLQALRANRTENHAV